jgi:yeast amino acid transporter
MDDREKAWNREDGEYSPSGHGSGNFEQYIHIQQQRKQSLLSHFITSFQRDPNAHAVPKAPLGGDGKTYDVEEAAQATATSPLQRHLKGRHLQMIAIGGSIGTGLFVGSGNALAIGGPASLILSFAITGAMLYCTVHALGEMAVLFPVAGSFSAYSTRFLDPAWGFAMGWK